MPAIESVRALADWLEVDHGDLAWFADLKGFEGRMSGAKLRHYFYRVHAKRSGGVRLIESPKPRLKAL